MKILQSASKIVFILVAVAVSAMTFMGIVDPKDYVALAGMAFTFYFSHKDSDEEGNITK